MTDDFDNSTVSFLLLQYGSPEKVWREYSLGHIPREYAAAVKIIASSNAYLSLIYSQHLGKRFELGEPAISKDTRLSYIYACKKCGEEFKLGEPAIAKEAMVSYLYARNVLKGRFELGEPVILTSAKYSYRYAIHILKFRWHEAEPLILDSAYDDSYKLYFADSFN